MVHVRKRLKQDGGMTLLELMIASGIMVMGFVMILGAIFSIARTNETTTDKAKATAQLASVLEEVRSLSFSELLSYEPPEAVGLGTYAYLVVECLDSEQNPWYLPIVYDQPEGEETGESYVPDLPNPIVIKVKLHWYDSGWGWRHAELGGVYRR